MVKSYKGSDWCADRNPSHRTTQAREFWGQPAGFCEARRGGLPSVPRTRLPPTECEHRQRKKMSNSGAIVLRQRAAPKSPNLSSTQAFQHQQPRCSSPILADVLLKIGNPSTRCQIRFLVTTAREETSGTFTPSPQSDCTLTCTSLAQPERLPCNDFGTWARAEVPWIRNKNRADLRRKV